MAALVVTNRLSELSRLSEHLRRFGTAHDFSEAMTMDVGVALEEVFVNIVHHAYPDNGEHSICVDLSVEDGSVIMTVEDDGVLFDPLGAPPADTTSTLDERPIGGLGIHLIRSLMEQVLYERDRGRNRLIMKKRIQRSA